MTWHRQAACRQVPLRVFFGGGPRNKAREICAQCPVRLDCLEEALSQESMGYRSGIRGGLTPTERDRLMAETLELYAR